MDGILNIASAGVNAISQGIQNAQNRKFQSAEAEKQRDWNEAMQDKANAWSLEMWNKTNEYNSPLAQIERMREAGLNPLYYGLDGSSANGLESAQALGYQQPDMKSTVNPIAAGIDAALHTAQISNIQADTAKKGQETLTEVQNREKIQADIEKTKQEIDNLKATEGLTKSQQAQIDKVVEWADRINSAAVAMHEANAALSNAQKNRIDKLLEGEQLIQAKTIEDFDRRWNKIDAEIKKMAAETGLAYLDIQNYALNHTSNGFMGTGLSLQNFVRAIQGQKPKADTENEHTADAMDSMYQGMGVK